MLLVDLLGSENVVRASNKLRSSGFLHVFGRILLATAHLTFHFSDGSPRRFSSWTQVSLSYRGGWSWGCCLQATLNLKFREDWSTCSSVELKPSSMLEWYLFVVGFISCCSRNEKERTFRGSSLILFANMGFAILIATSRFPSEGLVAKGIGWLTLL